MACPELAHLGEHFGAVHLRLLLRDGFTNVIVVLELCRSISLCNSNNLNFLLPHSDTPCSNPTLNRLPRCGQDNASRCTLWLARCVNCNNNDMCMVAAPWAAVNASAASVVCSGLLSSGFHAGTSGVWTALGPKSRRSSWK
jgi:hypothetical protein